MHHPGISLLSIVAAAGANSIWGMSMSMPSKEGQRVIWNGPFFGRLTKAGRNFLLQHGWASVECPPDGFNENDIHCTTAPNSKLELSKTHDISLTSSLNDLSVLLDNKGDAKISDQPLAFIWPNKTGPQFDSLQPGPALVRPFPTEITSIVDDKICLDELLKSSGILPPSIKVGDIETITNDDNKLFFVKHRHGAQGKSVYVHTKQSLLAWRRRCTNADDFIIQEEVEPALDKEGRKFVLRAHILLFHDPKSMTRSNDQGDIVNGFVTALHRDIICHTHTKPYEKSSPMRSVHISNAAAKQKRRKGKSNIPPPMLLAELPLSHPAYGVFDKVKACSSLLSDAFIQNIIDEEAITADSDATCFALMGADFLVASDMSVKLCEVNSHPALGWGTMSDVPHQVFVDLIEDSLSVLLLGNRFDVGFDRLLMPSM